MASGSVHSGSISSIFFVTLAEPEGLNLEVVPPRFVDKAPSPRPAAVANAKLPHQIVGLLERFR